MAIDYAMSSLYCAEDNASIFDDVDDSYNSCTSVIDDDFDVVSKEQGQNGNLSLNLVNQDQNFIGFLPDDECLSSLFDKERHFCPGVDYLKRLVSGDLDLVARNLAVDCIQKVKSNYNFGPLCYYLSVNYLDRFLSMYELPKGKAWMMQLLAVACVSLAAKIDETDVPFSVDLQVGESKFIFEAKTIQRMELLVMSTLNWRMQSVTPFSFMDHFLYKLNNDQSPPSNVTFQAIQLVLSTVKGVELLEFKPSEISAAIAIFVTQETQTVKHSDNALTSVFTQHLVKERVLQCVELMNGLVSRSIIPQSPIGVLDAGCLSYRSDDNSTSLTTPTPTGSCANSTYNSPDEHATKRRKVDHK